MEVYINKFISQFLPRNDNGVYQNEIENEETQIQVRTKKSFFSAVFLYAVGVVTRLSVDVCMRVHCGIGAGIDLA